MRLRLILFLSLLLPALVVSVFTPALSNEFLGYDDQAYVLGNSVVKRGLTADGWRWAWTTFHAANWHPLTWLSHMLDCQLFRSPETGSPQPVGPHAVNVVLHAANTLVLFLLLVRLTGAVWRPALVAGLFAVHPLHVESVAWIAERKDVLSTFFGLLAIAAYAGYVRRPTLLRYLPLAVAYTLSLLAKPMLVTLPFVLLLLDFWPLGRRTLEAADGTAPAVFPVRRLLLEKVPLLALAAGSCVVTVLAQSNQALVSLERLPLPARLANVLLAYTGYLRKLVWPVDLAIFYPHTAAHASLLAILASALVLTLLTGFAIHFRRRQPALLVGWLWYLGTLVPVIGLVQVGHQSMADRYTYFPLIGVFLALAWSIPVGLADDFRGLVGLGIVTAAVLAACLFLTRSQIRVWHDEETVMSHALQVTTDNAVAHQQLGTYLLDHYRLGRVKEGTEHLEKATQLDPKDALALHNLGLARLYEEKYAEALTLFERAVANAPQVGPYQNSLGVALIHLGRLDDACDHFREAIRLSPEFAPVYFNLGGVLDERGDHAQAASLFDKGLQLEPGEPWRELRLAVDLIEMPDRHFHSPPEALRLARQVNAATGGHQPEMLALLARAYYANGKQARAVEVIRQALAASSGSSNRFLTEQLLRAQDFYLHSAGTSP
jgi:Flp pilus assembly protein TadD